MGKIQDMGGEAIALLPENVVENDNRRKLGTDGLRGEAFTDITLDVAERFGFATAMATAKTPGTRLLVVGRDPRSSGPKLQQAAMEGAAKTGVCVLDVGMLPTPGVAYLCKTMKNTSGLMLSASHNPPKDNGLKPFDENGAKLDQGAVEKLEDYLNLDPSKRVLPPRKGEILSMYADGLRQKYENFLIGSVEANLFAGKKIVVDAANGAASHISLNVVQALGGEPIPFANDPQGHNINVDCGAEHPEFAKKAVVEQGADFGIVLDGDADRCFLVSETGKVLDGDHIMLINALAALERGELTNNTVVGTIMSNMGTEIAFKERGIEFVRADVGDANVAQMMKETGAVIGGEQSGHTILARHANTGDGMLAALQTVQSLRQLKMTLDEAYDLIKKYPQVSMKAPVPKAIKQLVAQSGVVTGAVKDLKRDLREQGTEGNVIVRPSGTESIMRITVELPVGHEDRAHQAARNIFDLIIKTSSELEATT